MQSSTPNRIPNGQAIFCDDIRAEADLRHTYVGVFQATAGFDVYPLLLPKFGVAVHYRHPIDDKAVSRTMQLVYEQEDGEPVQLASVPIDIADALSKLDQDGPWLSIHCQLLISPLQIGGPGLMRARMMVEGQEALDLGTLQFARTADVKPGHRIPAGALPLAKPAPDR